MESKERWKGLVIYENGRRISLRDFFKISSDGKVRSTGFFYMKKVKFTNRRGKEVTKIYKYVREEGEVKQIIKQGYPFVSLSSMGMKKRRRQFHVHKLVLWTFVGPCPKGMEARHKNDDKKDNRLENLAWGTHGDNMQDAYKNGMKKPMKGELNGMYGVDRSGEKNPNYRHGLRCSVN